MANFQFPSDGSVVIIDDKIKDALPLIQLLSKRGIASTYYSGNDNELPAEPIQKIRYAFVDIQLFPAGDSISYSTNIKRLLESLIPSDNGPYILFIWSTLELVHADTLQALITADDFEKRPAEVVRLQKSSFFISEYDNTFRDQLIEDVQHDLSIRFSDNDLDAIKNFIAERIPTEERKNVVDDALKKITAKLEEKLKGTDVFHLFTLWENLVNRSAGEIVNSFSVLHGKNKYWEQNLKQSIYRMSKAQLGTTVNTVSENELLRNALKTMNGTFMDSLENKLSNATNISSTMKIDKKNIFYSSEFDGLEYKIKLTNNKYSLYIDGVRMPQGNAKEAPAITSLQGWGGSLERNSNIALIIKEFISITPDINTKLLFDIAAPLSIQPGNVFEKKVLHWQRRRALIGNYYDKNANIFKKNALGGFEISNEELKKFTFIEIEVTPLCDYVQNKWSKSRLVSGILIPEEFNKNVTTAGHYLYSEIPIIKLNGLLYRPIIDFRLFKSVDIDRKPLTTPPLFRVRSELFADILSRLSSHANRVGIAYLE